MQINKKVSLFERHPKYTFMLIWLFFLLVFLVLSEVMLKQFTGLGSPVLFHKSSSFGYRLQPNQEITRFFGAHFKINNLGLRSKEDWDASVESKILFVGDSVTYGGNHISNEELFSEVAVKNLPNFQSGNAGIPNWGVENVHALIVKENFLPAEIYVSTFIEHDFYRGLTSGDNKPWISFEKPYFALQELAEFYWHKFIRNPKKLNKAEREKSPPSIRSEQAVLKLKEMDNLIKARGYSHVIFISPSLNQVLSKKQKDSNVESLLAIYGVRAIYLLDKVNESGASDDKKRSWYQDDKHLTSEGHRIWGEFMYDELRTLIRSNIL